MFSSPKSVVLPICFKKWHNHSPHCSGQKAGSHSWLFFLSYIPRLTHQQMLLILSSKYIPNLSSISAPSPVYTTIISHMGLYNRLLTVFFILTLALLQITVHRATGVILLKQKSDPSKNHLPSVVPLSLRIYSCSVVRKDSAHMSPHRTLWHPA